MTNTAEKPLAGRHALVTGATSGIGLGIAEALARAGCRLTINGMADAAAIDDLKRNLTRAGSPDVFHHPADLREASQVEALADAAIERNGAVGILVNNAGIQHVAPIQDFPVAQWNDIIAVNLSAAFHTIRCLLPGMLDASRGRIINIASAHALRASPYKAAYVSAKHGLAGLTKTVALEVAEHGITVNAVAPGYVETPLVTGQVTDTAKARGISEEAVLRDVMLLAQPTRRLITVEQVAELVLYLCSDAAAAITGAILPIDGGWTAK
jgi:3-hydroxybutyrate dehydrogenase